MELLDGKKVKLEILENLKEELKKLERKLGLVVIQIGEDPASCVYVNQKQKMAEKVGYDFYHIKLDEDVSEKEVLDLIDSFNEDPNVDGILVQMPLPSKFNTKLIQNRVDPLKDVDGLNDVNAGKLTHNVDCLMPCTPLGIIDILKHYNIDIAGKNVANPIATILSAAMMLRYSLDLDKEADAIEAAVAAVLKEGYRTTDIMSEGCTLVGTDKMGDLIAERV